VGNATWGRRREKERKERRSGRREKVRKERRCGKGSGNWEREGNKVGELELLERLEGVGS